MFYIISDAIWHIPSYYGHIENYLICMFMNINENLKIRIKPLDNH